MHQNTKARKLAFQFLYQFHFLNDSPHYYGHLQALDQLSIDKEWDSFTHLHDYGQGIQRKGKSLAEDVLTHYPELCRQISGALKRWKIETINRVDLTVLLLATSELFYQDTPFQIVIDEAIGIAKEFSQKDSPSFVNGVLDGIVRNKQAGQAS